MTPRPKPMPCDHRRTETVARGERREELIVRYLPLARNLAARYRTCDEPYEDLVQIASVGLVKAANRFDPSRGVAFGAFARPTILGELRRHLRDCAWPVHVERSSQQRASLIATADRQISAGLGRHPGVQELADHLGMSVDGVIDGLLAMAARRTTSIETPSNSGRTPSETRLERYGGSDPKLEQVVDVATVFAMARRLSKRERLVLYLRFGEDLPQTEIAGRLGLSQMHVSRIVRGALSRLRTLSDGAPARPAQSA